MIPSRNLADLDKDVREAAERFISIGKAVGIDILVTCTYRDFACQDGLYAQGRTKSGAKVTNAKGGESWHNWKRALDFVPIRNGKPIWDVHDPVWPQCGLIAEECGFEWGGRWKKFPDFPHLQITGGLDMGELLAKHPRGLV